MPHPEFTKEEYEALLWIIDFVLDARAYWNKNLKILDGTRWPKQLKSAKEKMEVAGHANPYSHTV